VTSSEARTALTPMWVVVGLAMGPAVALGLARFAYALLLPAMRADLGWNFAEAGAMNAANAAGYLAGALVAALTARWAGDKLLFAVSLLLTAITVAASGLTADFALLLALRLAAGFMGALVFISGAGLVAAAATEASKTRALTLLGVYFCGAGIGIIASALAVPSLLETVGWRGGWLVLGWAGSGWGGSRLFRPPAHSRTRARHGPAGRRMVAAHHGTQSSCLWSFRSRLHRLRFIIAYLRSEEGFSAASVSLFWSILGLTSVAAAFLWGPILARLTGGWGTAATIGVVMVGAAVPLLWSRPGGAYLSAILFGGSFLSVVAAVTAFARKAARPHAWTAVIAAFTVVFGLGQCIGPILSGALSDGPSGIRSGLWLSVGLLAAGSIVAVFQGEPSVE